MKSENQVENKEGKKPLEVLIIDDEIHDIFTLQEIFDYMACYGAYDTWVNIKDLYPDFIRIEQDKGKDLKISIKRENGSASYYSKEDVNIEEQKVRERVSPLSELVKSIRYERHLITSKNFYEDLKNTIEKHLEKVKKNASEEQKRLIENFMKESFDQIYQKIKRLNDENSEKVFITDIQEELEKEGYKVNINWLYPQNDIEAIEYLKEKENDFDVIVLDMGFKCKGYNIEKVKDLIDNNVKEKVQITEDIDGKEIHYEDLDYFTFPCDDLKRYLDSQLESAGGLYVGEFLKQIGRKFTFYTDYPRHAIINESLAYLMDLLRKEDLEKTNKEFKKIWSWDSKSNRRQLKTEIGKSKDGNFCMGFKSTFKNWVDVIKTAIEYQVGK